MNMMMRIRDDYIMLCDQDDVWLPNKIEKSLRKIKQMEAIHGKETPLLVHTDLIVTDEDLNIISPSFKKAMKADYNRTSLNQQIIQNTLTGCTVIYNRALAEKINAEPKYMVMHDWWLMLIASAFGRIGHIDDATVLYRQHRKNEVGAKDVRTLKYKIHKLINFGEVKQALDETYRQTASFLQMYRYELRPDQTRMLKCYTEFPKYSKIKKIWLASKLGILKCSFARIVAYYLLV
jgi:hypothetical protein